MDNYYTHLRRGHNYMRLNEEVIEPSGHATDLFSSWALDYFDTMHESKVPFFFIWLIMLRMSPCNLQRSG